MLKTTKMKDGQRQNNTKPNCFGTLGFYAPGIDDLNALAFFFSSLKPVINAGKADALKCATFQHPPSCLNWTVT